MDVDTFTTDLRYIIGSGLALLFLFVVGSLMFGGVRTWWEERKRRKVLERHEDVWDWRIDGGVSPEEPGDDDGYHQLSHVRVIGRSGRWT